MKVICRCCRKLIEEKQAVKMNEVEYRIWEDIRNGGHGFQFHNTDYQIYTQICIKCYKKKTEEDLENEMFN